MKFCSMVITKREVVKVQLLTWNRISAAEKYPNINLKFNKKLTGGRVENGEVVFIEYARRILGVFRAFTIFSIFSTTTRQPETVQADLVVGCDGAFSAVRREMLKRPGFNYNQTYIEHGYLELCIPPGKDGEVGELSKIFFNLIQRASFSSKCPTTFSTFGRAESS